MDFFLNQFLYFFLKHTLETQKTFCGATSIFNGCLTIFFF